MLLKYYQQKAGVLKISRNTQDPNNINFCIFLCLDFCLCFSEKSFGMMRLSRAAGPSIPAWPESIPRFLRYTFWPRCSGQKLYLKNRGIVSGQGGIVSGQGGIVSGQAGILSGRGGIVSGQKVLARNYTSFFEV